jgi:hypothetical protein
VSVTGSGDHRIMSLSTEPSAITDQAGIPADPTAYRRRSGLKWWLIIVGVIVWTIICVVGALVIAGLGKPQSGGEAVLPLNLPFVSHPTEPAPAPQPAIVAPSPAAAPVAADAALTARIEKLEAQQGRSNQAAASALAAASLAEAAASAAPFDAELASIGQLLPATADMPALQRLARQGAPTRTALAAEFTETVTRAAAAAHEPAEGSGFMAKLSHALSRIVTIRRVNDVAGSGSDAILARAQRELEDGDLEAAVADLDKLPVPARRALAGWRERAQRRLDIDRQVSAIRTAAMRDLAASSGARP